MILALLVILSYANSLQNGFTWDDNQQILMNPALRPGASLSPLFSSGVWAFYHSASASHNDYYRPLQMITYRAAISIRGFDPVVFHAISILFAAAATVLAFALFCRLTQRAAVAFTAAALFAVHPVHTEAIDWASALPDIGCTIFLLAGFLLFLELAGRPAMRDRLALWVCNELPVWMLSLACFAAALLWKETAAVFPLLVAASVFLTPLENRSFRQSTRAAAGLSLPFWIVLVAYLFIRWQALGFVVTKLREWQLTPLQFALTVPHLMMSYWWKLIAPVGLNAYHIFSAIMSPFDFRAVLGVLSLATALSFIVYMARRAPLLAFSALWVFITLLPAMDIYAVGRNVFAERYLYLPSVGFCLFVTILGFEASNRIPKRFRAPAGIGVLSVALALFALETAARNPDWKDDATLFARTVQSSPNAPFVQNMVAAAEIGDTSNFDAAEEHYRKAASLASAETPPDRLQIARAYEGLAWIYSQRSDFNRAVDLLNRVRQLDPSDPEVDGEEGLILSKAGRWDEAAIYLQRAAAASRQDENVLNALGLYSQQRNHQLDQAAAYFLRALAVHTKQDDFSASLHNNLGSVYGEQGRYSDAAQEFQAAIAAAPNELEYHTNLATAFAAAGRYDDARSEIRAVLAIAPGYEPARALLQEFDRRQVR
jgi:tetratricopeptide (TPR) repeat protein